jgi:hypothetical protein
MPMHFPGLKKVQSNLVVFPGYGVNPARLNGADREPVPISPVHGQSWPGMQVQLRNGWGITSFGRRLTYDDYLRMLTAATGNAPGKPRSILPGQGAQHMQGPGAKQYMNSLPQANTTKGGVGLLAPGVDLGERRYYG